MKTASSSRDGKIGRNDPCPSGAGVKFKKCLQQHPQLDSMRSAAAVWWVCSRWQGEEPDLASLSRGWRQLREPDHEKLGLFLDRLFAEPVDSVDWSRLLRECAERGHPDLPGLYRRITPLLHGLTGAQPVWLQAAAAEVLHDRHPELYEEILEATLALDVSPTGSAPLEAIVVWAKERERPDDLKRLRERFPQLPGFRFEEPEDIDDSGEEIFSGEVSPKESATPGFPPEIEERQDEIWEEFGALESPGPGDAEAFVDALCALPAEATSWAEVVDEVRECEHLRIFDLFSRIVSFIGPDSRDLSFVCWGAIEEAVKRGETDRLPAIATQLHQLNSRSYDCDAVSHVADHLLAYGFPGECLELLETTFPLLQDCDNVFDWAVTEAAAEIVILRTGRALASGALTEIRPTEICAGFEEKIDVTLTGRALTRFFDDPDRALSANDFQLPLASFSEEKQEAMWVALQTAFLAVALDAFRKAQLHPARTLSGLQMIYRAAVRTQAAPRKKGTKLPTNVLGYLDPKLIERQLASECQDIMGINNARALTMLDAHLALTCQDALSELLTAGQCADAEQEVRKLIGIVSP